MRIRYVVGFVAAILFLLAASTLPSAAVVIYPCVQTTAAG
jgi:hypothetical protein